MTDLICQIKNAVNTHILTPFPPEFHLELLKKNNVPFPTTLWSGENDLEKFEGWVTKLLSWISGNGWKGPQFNELHVNALCWALDGDPKLIALLNVC